MTSPVNADLDLDFHIVGETGFCFSSDSSIAVAASKDVVLEFASRYHRREPLNPDSPLLCVLSEGVRNRVQAAFQVPRCEGGNSDGYTEAKRLLRGLMTIESARRGALQGEALSTSYDEPITLEAFEPYHLFDKVVRNRESSWGGGGNQRRTVLARITLLGAGEIQRSLPICIRRRHLWTPAVYFG